MITRMTITTQAYLAGVHVLQAQGGQQLGLAALGRLLLLLHRLLCHPGEGDIVKRRIGVRSFQHGDIVRRRIGVRSFHHGDIVSTRHGVRSFHHG